MAHIPERMCIACREHKPKNKLIRLIMADGAVKTDKTGNTLTRGAYICPNGKCIALAKKKKALSRHFKTNVEESVYDELLKELEDE